MVSASKTASLCLTETEIEETFLSYVKLVPSLASKVKREQSRIIRKRKRNNDKQVVGIGEEEMKERFSEEILFDMKQLKSSAPRIDQNLLPIPVSDTLESDSSPVKNESKGKQSSKARQFNFEKLYAKPRKLSCFERMLPAGVKTYELDVSTVQIMSGQKCGCEGCLAHYPDKGGWLTALAGVLDHHMKFGGRIGLHCKLVRDYLQKKAANGENNWCEDAMRTARQVSETLDKAIKSPKHKYSNGNFVKLIAIGIVRFEIGRRLTRIFPSFGLPVKSEENIELLNRILKEKFGKEGQKYRASRLIDPILLEFKQSIEDRRIDELTIADIQGKLLPKVNVGTTLHIICVVALYLGRINTNLPESNMYQFLLSKKIKI